MPALVAVEVVGHVDEGDRVQVRKRGKLLGEARPPLGVQSRSERDEDRSAGEAQDVRDLSRFEHRVDRERCAGGFAAPNREVGIGKVGQDIGHRAVGRDAEGGEEVRRARHVRDEFGVGPDMRLVEPVGRQEERKRLAVGAPLRSLDESRIGTLGQRPLRERNGFDRGDVGLVSDRQVRLLWKSRPRRRRARRENHRHGRAGFATLLFSASIFLSRGLSLTASLSTLRSRRGVSLASTKSSGRSGPH